MNQSKLTDRRRFFQHAGAALVVPLVATGAHAAPGQDDGDALQTRLDDLQDRDAIRRLTQAWLDGGAVEPRIGPATGAADAAGGEGIRRLTAAAGDLLDGIALAPDRRSATARIRGTAEIEAAMPDCTLVAMARQQGGGVVRRPEQGVLETRYLKRAGEWRMEGVRWHPG